MSNNYPMFYQKICKACMACYDVCPMDAINLQKIDKRMYPSIVDEEKCIKCYRCIEDCPVNAVVINE